MTEPVVEKARQVDAEEARLVAGAQSGDLRAFEGLYRLHAGRVYALCLRLTADPLRAESLAQDAFVRAWQKLASYRGEGAFGAWLRRLAVNVVIEDRRRAGRERKREVPYEEGRTMNAQDELTMSLIYGAQRGTGIGDGSSSSDLGLDLERAVAALPPGAREAFVLHDVNGYRHHEIAEMTGVATGTVKSQLHRARRLLRKALSWNPEVLRS